MTSQWSSSSASRHAVFYCSVQVQSHDDAVRQCQLLAQCLKRKFTPSVPRSMASLPVWRPSNAFGGGLEDVVGELGIVDGSGEDEGTDEGRPGSERLLVAFFW